MDFQNNDVSFLILREEEGRAKQAGPQGCGLMPTGVGCYIGTVREDSQTKPRQTKGVSKELNLPSFYTGEPGH